jgi:predicted permease
MTPLRPLLRRLARAPGFTTVAVLTLASGIGANTAIVRVLNGILLRPLPYPEPDRLVWLRHTAAGIDIPEIGPGPSMYFTYREQGRAFEAMGLWGRGTDTVTGLGEPEEIRVLRVTAGTLDALGVRPAIGRWFSEGDDTPGTAETVILTDAFWRRAFGADPSAIGRALLLDGRPRDVVGVMPRDFRFLDEAVDAIVPLRFDREQIFLGNFSFQGLARLAPGSTVADAEADVARMLPIWLGAWPVPPGFDRAVFESARLAPAFVPLQAQVVGDIGAVLWVLMGTIGVVLLIACANVANLLLVRVEGRQPELAIRAALGAGRGRLARELLVESTALGLLGGAAGVALAFGGVRLLLALAPANLPRLAEVTFDLRALAFALAAALVSGLLFGAIPLLRRGGLVIAAALHGGVRTASHGRERLRVRNVLVVVQVALALVLLVSAGLMIRTFQSLLAVEPGFTRPADVQLFRLSIPDAAVDEPEAATRMQHDLVDRLAALPGVEAVALTSGAPMEEFNSADVIYVDDRNYAVEQVPPIREFKFIAPGLFAALGAPIVAGRDLTWTDVHEGRMVVLVSESFAREMWDDPTAAIGRRLRQGPAEPWREIVGVAADLRDNGVHEPAPVTVHWPILRREFWGDTASTRTATFVIRTPRAATAGFLAEVRDAVWAVNPNLPLAQIRTLDDVYRQSLGRTTFTVVMLGLAGAMALLLGLVGIYGVISYTVSQRTKEIGIRMALGGPPHAVRRMFVRQAVVLAAVGVVAGLAAAAGASRLLGALLYGTSPLDPVTYVAVAMLLLTTSALASYVPARRAAALNPIDALRTD